LIIIQSQLISTSHWIAGVARGIAGGARGIIGMAREITGVAREIFELTSPTAWGAIGLDISGKAPLARHSLAAPPLHWFVGHCIGFALVAPPLTNLSATDFSATGFLALLLSQAVLLLQIVSS
jgi:hypothetical protein